MVFCWILRQIYITNLWLTIFIFEYQDILWVYEYEIECFKASIVMRRINAWLRPYRIYSKHVIGYVNTLEHTKIGYLYQCAATFVQYTCHNFFSYLILVRATSMHVINLPLFSNTLFFTEITFLRAKNLLIWAYMSRFGFKPVEYRTIPYQHNKLLYELSKHWVFQTHNFERTHVLDSVFVLNSFSTFYCGAMLVFKKSMKNIIKGFTISKYTLLVFVVVTLVVCIYLFSQVFYFTLLKNSGLYIVSIIFLYILVSTFFNFSKTYAVNKYTSQTQRFWKRTFGVFWGLEFTLFMIYMYFTLISPAELAMQSANYKEITTGLNINKTSQYHLIYLLILVFLNFLYVCLLILKKKNNFHLIRLVFFVLNLTYCYIVYYEFLKFYYTAGWGTHTVHTSVKTFINNVEYNNLINANNLEHAQYTRIRVPNSINNSWNEVSYEKQWVRTFRHFVYITILLKFWHIFFIYVHFALSLLKFLETGYLSFDTISSNHQNTVYIIWFYLFSYLLIVKKKLYFLITFIYYWSFVQINYSSFISSTLHEFNYLYIF